MRVSATPFMSADSMNRELPAGAMPESHEVVTMPSSIDLWHTGTRALVSLALMVMASTPRRICDSMTSIWPSAVGSTGLT
jgi:hypothetical protein